MVYSSSATITSMCPVDLDGNDRVDSDDLTNIQSWANNVINGFLAIESDDDDNTGVLSMIETNLCVRVIFRIIEGTENVDWRQTTELLPSERQMLSRKRVSMKSIELYGGFDYGRYR
jgi:hypothetical protein